MRNISIILPYYRNAEMLLLQLERFATFPAETRAQIELLVIDDGSPKQQLREMLLRAQIPELLSVRAWRIIPDIRWNWLAARNIGQLKASSEWRLFTDIDHLVPFETADYLIRADFRADTIYRFARTNFADGSEYKPHPNSWWMTGQMMESVGGYDERFSGFYGTDGMFRDRCTARAREIVLLKQALQRVDRADVPDASTRTYKRKAPEDLENVPRIRQEIVDSGDLRPHRLTFPYFEIWPRLGSVQ